MAFNGAFLITPFVIISHVEILYPFNDTHMEELDSVQKFIEIQGCLLLMFFICLHNQLIFFNSIIVQMSEKQIHQVDSKNEWLLL